MHLNDQSQYILDYLSIKKPGLKDNFEKWLKGTKFEFKDYDPSEIYKKHKQLNSVIKYLIIFRFQIIFAKKTLLILIRQLIKFSP